MQKDLSTEERILSAAQKVFLAKGMDGARMQDIADEAGINKALLHYYFRSKDKLFEQIFLKVTGSFLPKIFIVLNTDNSLFEKIESFCQEYISQIVKTPYVPIFILNEINRQPDTFLKKVFGNNKPPVEKLYRQITAEVEAGRIKPIEPVQLLMNVISLCVFPVLAAPVIRLMGNLNNEQFNQLMEGRKKEVPQLIINSIKM